MPIMMVSEFARCIAASQPLSHQKQAFSPNSLSQERLRNLPDNLSVYIVNSPFSKGRLAEDMSRYLLLRPASQEYAERGIGRFPEQVLGSFLSSLSVDAKNVCNLLRYGMFFFIYKGETIGMLDVFAGEHMDIPKGKALLEVINESMMGSWQGGERQTWPNSSGSQLGAFARAEFYGTADLELASRFEQMQVSPEEHMLAAHLAIYGLGQHLRAGSQRLFYLPESEGVAAGWVSRSNLLNTFDVFGDPVIAAQ